MIDKRKAYAKFGLTVVVGALLLLITASLACASKSSPTAAPTAPAAKPTAVPTAAATATTPSQVKGTPVYGGTLRLAVNLGMKSLDPLHPSGEYREQYAFFAIYNSLVEVDENFTIRPSLAKSWDISADGKTITLHLQSGVKFQDGTAFNAQAAKWMIDNIVKDDFGARIKPNFQPFISNVAVVDDNTLAVTTV